MERRGLSAEEAAAKLAEVGPNTIRAQKSHAPWRIFLEQFKSPLVLILLFACVVSFALDEWIDGLAILVILLLNAVIGFVQEYRAETAVQELLAMTAPRARVLRDGRAVEIAAAEVVPGDWLLIEAGDVVAADGVLHEAARLQINESVLTGESLPVAKSASSTSDTDSRIFMGTAVATGTGGVEVTATGMQTELGKIAHLITTAEDSATPLQVQLTLIGRRLLVLCLLVVAVVFAIGWIRGQPFMELLLFGLSLAVAAVPEGLPAIVTVALAFGVQRMAARNALIRKLPSVETLGSVSVICTDKTGTLTTGQMRVREIWGEDHSAIILAAASCCDAELGDDRLSDVGDPTEIAILIEARERGIEHGVIESENPRVSIEPFDSERKWMSIERADEVSYLKGAPEAVLRMCRASAQTAKAASVVDEMSSRGLRLLAVATGEAGDLEFLGVIGFADPPRAEVMEAIAEAKSAGILPIMITGDHPNTAVAVARELGLITADDPLEGRVHARATPEDKLRIVREWKNKGAIVAMTGDGVNDAPALREAHIGIAMGKTGTSVTRQAADLVLADDNFATIVAAVREGRGVYQSIRKAVVYLLTGNFAEIVMVLGASLAGMPIPFLAAHLLWINLVTDALPGLALIADPTPNNLMRAKPRPPEEQLLGAREWRRVIATGTLEALAIGVLYWIELRESGVEHARDLAFTALVMSQLFRSFAARSRTRLFWQVGALSNLWLVGVVAATFAAQIALHHVPLGQRVFQLQPIGVDEILWMLPFALVTVSVLELAKLGNTWRAKLSA